MQIPESLYREQLGDTALAVANPNAPQDGYESYLVISPSEHEQEVDFYHLAYTALYTMPGEQGPLLRKAHFNRTDIPDEQRDDMVGYLNLEMVEQGPSSMNNNAARMVASFMVEACKLVQEKSSVIIPYQLLAVLGFYSTTDQRPFTMSFTATNFVETIMAVQPEPTDVEWDEEKAKEMYAYEAEQRRSIEPFAEYREMMRESILNYQPAVHKRDDAKATVAMLLLPATVTHPILNARLFKEPR